MALIDRLKTLAKSFGDPIWWWLSRRELHALLEAYPTGCAAHVVLIVSEHRGYGWYKRLSALQVGDELGHLADWARVRRPRVIVEIGTARGGTLLMWSRIARERVISIDLPGGIHGGGYAAAKTRLFREFVHDRPGVRVDLLRASSHDTQTKHAVMRLLDGAAVDILFIDGDHRLEGVTRDFELWHDLVRTGGSIVFHDILPNVDEPTCHVDVLWQTVTRQYPGQTEEIVSDRNQGGAGIGILTV